MDEKGREARRRYTRERSWTAERVCEAYKLAWRAPRPKTMEFAEIQNWPAVYLPPNDWEARRAMQMVGLNAEFPLSYSLKTLAEERLGWSWSKFERARLRGCGRIAELLNAGVIRHIDVEDPEPAAA